MYISYDAYPACITNTQQKPTYHTNQQKERYRSYRAAAAVLVCGLWWVVVVGDNPVAIATASQKLRCPDVRSGTVPPFLCSKFHINSTDIALALEIPIQARPMSSPAPSTP